MWLPLLGRAEKTLGAAKSKALHRREDKIGKSGHPRE
jgi:hypothetical protein